MVPGFQKLFSLIRNPFLCQIDAVEEEDFQEELLELRRDGDAKMLQESSENLIEFWLKVRGKYLQVCKGATQVTVMLPSELHM